MNRDTFKSFSRRRSRPGWPGAGFGTKTSPCTGSATGFRPIFGPGENFSCLSTRTEGRSTRSILEGMEQNGDERAIQFRFRPAKRASVPTLVGFPSRYGIVPGLKQFRPGNFYAPNPVGFLAQHFWADSVSRQQNSWSQAGTWVRIPRAWKSRGRKVPGKESGEARSEQSWHPGALKAIPYHTGCYEISHGNRAHAPWRGSYCHVPPTLRVEDDRIESET